MKQFHTTKSTMQLAHIILLPIHVCQNCISIDFNEKISSQTGETLKFIDFLARYSVTKIIFGQKWRRMLFLVCLFRERIVINTKITQAASMNCIWSAGIKEISQKLVLVLFLACDTGRPIYLATQALAFINDFSWFRDLQCSLDLPTPSDVDERSQTAINTSDAKTLFVY